MCPLFLALRSAKIGEQCEAIVRFPKLFEKYPFPILINSSFLKLAEFFQNGSNLLRLWILRVCQQTEKHLDKIINVDEFVKRIFWVTHSNNPMERALAIRTLGAVAVIIAEKQQVHHAIRSSLDSHDIVEIEAAIYASGRFASQSKSFAISMCSKVGCMIESLQTPVNMKLQLIPVLKHMHHDANTAAMVKTLCVNLLPKYPSENFVIVILDTLSELSCSTLIDIPEQVHLLLTYMEDPRQKVRCQVLNSLKTMAEKAAHLWSQPALNSLLKTAMDCTDEGNERTIILDVILKLTNCPVTCHSLLDDDNHLVVKLCASCLVLENQSAASYAVQILSSLVCYSHAENRVAPPSLLSIIDMHLESLLMTTWATDKHLREFSIYLKCGVQLSKVCTSFGENFVDIVGCMLPERSSYSPKHTLLVAEALAAICSQFCIKQFENDNSQQFENPVHELIWKIVDNIEFLVNSGAWGDNIRIIEVLSAVVFQALIGHQIPREVFMVYDGLMGRINDWSLYRIARSASRFGHHFIAGTIYKKLAHSVPVDKLHFFLTSLFQIAQAECLLVNGYTFEQITEDYAIIEDTEEEQVKSGKKRLSLVEKLDMAISLYWKALATLKASSSPTQAMSFQAEFVRLRGQFLEALFSVVITKNTQTMTPPPAIAQTLAQNSRDHLQRFGHVTTQLRKSVKTFKVCEEMYGKLFKTSFDADPGTLDHLEIAKCMCVLLGHSTEVICFTSPQDVPHIGTEQSSNVASPETEFFMHCLRKIRGQLERLPQEAANKKSITNNHTDVLLRQVQLMVNTPLCMPRYFFQVLQSTTIKLSVMPGTPGEAISVNPNTNLVVKVEGVIQHGQKNEKRSRRWRHIESVQLNLTSQLMQKSNDNMGLNKMMVNDGISTTMVQLVKPHHDFISGSFLLPLHGNNGQVNSAVTGIGGGGGGNWQLTVEPMIMDENGALWKCSTEPSVLHVVVAQQKMK